MASYNSFYLSVLFVATSTIFQASGLKCYQCTNCETVTSEQLLTCNITVPEPTTSSPPNPPTNIPGSSTTNIATDFTSTTESPTDSIITLTESTTDASYTTTESTTDASNTTTESTTDASDTTMDSTTDARNTTVNSYNYDVFVVKSSIIMDENDNKVFLDDDCFCEKEFCNCGGRLFFPSFDGIKAENLTIVCVTDTVTINGTSTTNRGCAVKTNSTEETCSLSNYSPNCKTCEGDGCNQPSLAVSLAFSTVLLIPVLATIVRSYE